MSPRTYSVRLAQLLWLPWVPSPLVATNIHMHRGFSPTSQHSRSSHASDEVVFLFFCVLCLLECLSYLDTVVLPSRRSSCVLLLRRRRP